MLEDSLLILGTIITIFCLYGIYKLFSKSRYDFNGIDIILFQLIFMFVFHIGYYFPVGQIVSNYLLVILAFYYLIKIIKSNNLISWKTILLYIFINIVNLFSLSLIEFSGWGGLGVLLIFFVLFAALISYLVILNIIKFFINKKNDVIASSDKINIWIKMVIFIFTVLPFICGLSFREFYHIDLKNDASNILVEYLNDKFGVENYKFGTKYLYYN